MAVGLSTLLVTSAVSLSANAAEGFDYKSYAEAQYIAATGALGDPLIDPLGDVLEGGEFAGTDVGAGGANAFVDTAAGTPETDGPNYVAGPLDPLKALTGPVGDALGSEGVGAVGSYAFAQRDASDAASGAVTNAGLVQVGGGDAPPANAVLNLSGPGQPLEPLNALANVTLDLGALGSQASLEENAPTSPSSTVGIAQGSISAEVVALGTILDAIGDTLGDPDITIGEPGVLAVSVTGVQNTLDAVTTVSNGGVTVNLQTGLVTLNIDELLEAATDGNVNFASLSRADGQQDLLNLVATGVTEALPGLLAQANTQVLGAIGTAGLQLDTLGTITPITLDAVAPELVEALTTAIDTLITSAVAPLSAALTDGLNTLTTELRRAISVDVNVIDEYVGLVGDRLETTTNVYSATAVRVTVLGAAGDGGLADLFLGNSLVGANSRTPIVQQDQAAAGDDGTQADGTIADAAADAQADAIADADAQADADVTSSLPNAGAPNLLPFWLLGLGLVAFGAAVLVNERRRALI
ncbi:hypothetical protein GCM10009821_25540 [Aeromicrobium halocynthiae]|uniref:Choice-of-anchor G family protein n=1 Tax=Aeromicrobium halocynthiae TaxID=560557 RepID=A0ABN2W4H7_9ACTN